MVKRALGEPRFRHNISDTGCLVALPMYLGKSCFQNFIAG